MPQSSGSSNVTGSVRVHTGRSKSSITRYNHPDRYYKQVWVSKKVYLVLEFVSMIERISLMDALERLLIFGIRKYFGQKIGEWNRRMIEAARNGLAATRTQWERGFLKWMSDGGIDARDFFTFVSAMPGTVDQDTMEHRKDAAVSQPDVPGDEHGTPRNRNRPRSRECDHPSA